MFKLSKILSKLSMISVGIIAIAIIVSLPLTAKAAEGIEITQEDYDYMYDQIMNRETIVDVSDLKILLDSNGDDILATGNARSIYSALKTEYIDTFIVSEYDFTTYKEGKNIYLDHFEFKYDDSYDMDLFYSYVDDAMSRIEPEMSDVVKTIILHDYVLSHTAYDLENYLNGIMIKDCHNAYGTLVNQRTVCEGYAKTLHCLLNMAGVESYYVHGLLTAPEGHAWVMVVIDGEAYHIELTSDDPNMDVLGRVWHESLLIDDASLREMLDMTINDWAICDYEKELDLKATSTKYDDYYWKTVNSPLCYVDGKFYFSTIVYDSKKDKYVKSISYNLADAKSGEPIPIVQWGKEADEEIYDGWTCSSMVEYIDGRIYYNTAHGISSCTPKGKENREEYRVEVVDGYMVYGAQYRDKQFYYTLSQYMFIDYTEEYLQFTDNERVYWPEEEDIVEPDSSEDEVVEIIEEEPDLNYIIEPAEDELTVEEVDAPQQARVGITSILLAGSAGIIIAIAALVVLVAIIVVVIIVVVKKKKSKK